MLGLNLELACPFFLPPSLPPFLSFPDPHTPNLLYIPSVSVCLSVCLLEGSVLLATQSVRSLLSVLTSVGWYWYLLKAPKLVGGV